MESQESQTQLIDIRKTGGWDIFFTNSCLVEHIIRRPLSQSSLSGCKSHSYYEATTVKVTFPGFRNHQSLTPLVESESWTIKKAEHRRIDAFELWCWRRLLRVPWTAGRSNQSHSEGDQPWDYFGRNDAKAETPVLWPPHVKS